MKRRMKIRWTCFKVTRFEPVVIEVPTVNSSLCFQAK